MIIAQIGYSKMPKCPLCVLSINIDNNPIYYVKYQKTMFDKWLLILVTPYFLSTLCKSEQRSKNNMNCLSSSLNTIRVESKFDVKHISLITTI